MKGEKVPLAIEDQDFMISQTKQTYGRDPVGAFKEYISNAIDAYHGKRGPETKIEVTINKEEGLVIVQDYGSGMPYEMLRSRPGKLGSSSKRDDPKYIGQKAIALLAFCSIGDRATWHTRTSEDNGSYSYLTIHRDERFAEPGKLEARLAEPWMKHEFRTGTRVTVSGVPRKTIEDYFTPSNLKYALASMYDPLLRSKQISIEIGYQGKKERVEVVEPLERKGAEVSSDLQETKEKVLEMPDGTARKGLLEIQLWANPDGVNEKIGIYNRGVKVLDSIVQMSEFDRFPWNSGKISGYVNADFLDLVPSRDGIVRDAKFKELCAFLNGYEADMAEYARMAEEDGAKRRMRDVLDNLVEKLGCVYTNRPNPFTRGTGTPLENPRRPPQPTGEAKRRKAPYSIDMMEFSENEAGLRSKLDGDSLILINRAHRNFVHFADNRKANDREALQYFADVIAKEAAWADYRAGRKALCRENENPSFTMNEESMRAIQERASELKLELLESFGIIKKRQKAKVIA